MKQAADATIAQEHFLLIPMCSHSEQYNNNNILIILSIKQTFTRIDA
jgi:hypothetical protein